MYNKQNNS